MPHGVVEWRKSDRDDLHDNPYSCSIRTFAKHHISHQGVVRLIAVRESGWEGNVDDIVRADDAVKKNPMDIGRSMASLCS
jgi:hypothetical protein